MIFLGVREFPRLGDGVLIADVVTRSYSVDLSAYPKWLVVLAGTMVAALIIWTLMKVLKWALWFMFFAVIVGGVMWAGYLMINPPIR